jgi:hypothetical protein
MGKKIGQCSPAQITAYNKAAETRELTLSAASGKLRARNIVLAPSDRERRLNTVKIADLTAESAALFAEVDAFNTSLEAINPPTRRQLDDLKEQLDAVNALTTRRRILEDVVTATTEAATTFREIQPA